MYNPFQTLEDQKNYPNRKDCRNADEVADHIKTLVDGNVITLDGIKHTPLGELKYTFFLNVDCYQIMDGIVKYENLHP